MVHTVFPSEDFPAFPSISIERPESWSPRSFPGTVLAVIEDRGPSAFSPNVVVTTTRVDSGHTLAQAQHAVEQYVQGLRSLQPIDAAVVEFGGREWSVAEFAHTTDEAGTVVQVIAVTVVVHGGIADVVRLTGSALPSQAQDALPQVREIVRSAVIETS